MPTITVHTTPTSYRLVTTPSLYIPNTPINLYHHLRPFNELKWDYQQKRMVPKKHYYFRNEDDGMTFIPRYDLPRFVNMVESRGGQVRTREVPLEWGKKIDIPLADWYKPRDQTQIDALDYAVNNDNPMRCLALQPGAGKFLSLDTLIKIPGGWRCMGDIKVGDTVISQDGTPTRVTGVYPQGVQPAFMVTFWDGRSVIAGAEHLWLTFYKNTTKKQQWKVRTTEEMRHILTLYNSDLHVPLIEPEEMPEADHIIHPYVLGHYIGNGCISQPGTTFICDFPELIPRIDALLPTGYNVQQSTHSSRTYIISKPMEQRSPSIIISELKRLGLAGCRSWEKAIPAEYLKGSVEQRWELLRGLMDSDGTAGTNGTMTYSTSSMDLAVQVIDLVRSLGGIAHTYPKNPQYTYKGKVFSGRVNFVISIRHPTPTKMFHLEKRRSRVRDDNQYSPGMKLRVKSITPVAPREMQCIAVDHPSRLYVCGSYIVTHNTSVGIVSASRIGRRALIKTPILVNQWIGAIKKFTKLTDDDIYVISGSASLARLISEIDKTLFPKIILASVQTIRSYAQREAPYHIFPRIEDFCNLCDIGIVVSDEVHLFFHTGLMLDMMLNPRVMIPMSATYEVTDRQIEPIFNGHFPKNLRFGEDRYERYVTVTSYTFDIPSDKLAKSQYRTFAGYNHTLYEKDLLKKKPVIDRIIRDVYYPILEMEYFSYAQPGERLLIICARTEMCAYMVKILKRDYPDKKVALFIAGTPESVKSENDIIVSTVKSAGVGFDVPNLITTFVTVAADSPPLNKQLLGRLRKVEGRDPRLAYVACRQLESHRKYTQTRRMVFPPLAKEFHAHHL